MAKDKPQDEQDEQNERIQIEGLAIDLSEASVREWAEFTQLENARMLPLEERTRRQAAYLVRWIKALPDGWGDPSEVETYLDLKFFSQWLPLVTALWQSVEDERKKAMTRYMTP